MNYLGNKGLRVMPTLPALIVLGISATVASAQSDVTLVPTNPTTLEPVVVRVLATQTCVFDPHRVRIQQTGAAIRVDIAPKLDPGIICVVTGANETHDILIGRFPPGTFNVVVYYGGNMQVASIPFTVTDSYPSKTGPFPIDDYTDHWWDPQELGWGISIMQHTSDRIVATWFVYDQAGHPVWYSLQPGQWTIDYPVAVYTGPVYKTTGPYFGAPFDSSKLSITQVGTGTLTFTDHNNGTFAYTVEGNSAEKPITRLSF